MEYLAVYDIADPRRLRRIARTMQEFGIRVQKSVFECHLTGSQFKKLQQKAISLMDLNEDGVRLYPLFADSRTKQTIIGQGTPAEFPTAYVA